MTSKLPESELSGSFFFEKKLTIIKKKRIFDIY